MDELFSTLIGAVSGNAAPIVACLCLLIVILQGDRMRLMKAVDAQSKRNDALCEAMSHDMDRVINEVRQVQSLLYVWGGHQ